MSKDNKNQHKNKSVEWLKKNIKTTFAILISNRGVSYRKELYTYMDKLFPPGKAEKTWKGYFLYPEKIPAKYKKTYLKAMWQALALRVLEMEKEINIQKSEKLKEISFLKVKLSEIKNFKTLYYGKQAV